MARTWSAVRSNAMTPDTRDLLKTQAVVAGISAEAGLETYLVRDRSIDQSSFVDFLTDLRATNGNHRLAIFMDNLAVHKTAKVRRAMADLNMDPIFNVPYSPDYNGIESFWSMIKSAYKKDLLQLS